MEYMILYILYTQSYTLLNTIIQYRTIARV
jgi:hypothetical protein